MRTIDYIMLTPFSIAMIFLLYVFIIGITEGHVERENRVEREASDETIPTQTK